MRTSTRCNRGVPRGRTRWAGSVRALLTSFLLLLLVSNSFAQSFGTDFSQSSNNNSPNPQGYVVWIGSILQKSNSTFYEGQSTLQRAFFMNVPIATTGQYKLLFSHQATKGGIHAYDFVLSWQAAIASSNALALHTYDQINSCSNLGPKVSSTQCSQFDAATGVFAPAITASDYGTTTTGDNVGQRVAAFDAQAWPGGRAIELRAISSTGANVTISNAQLVFVGYSTGSDQYAQYELRWTGPTSGDPYNVLVLLAGHLAKTGDGTGITYDPPDGGSANINGGPYHFKLDEIVLNNNSTVGNSSTSSDNVSLGSQDNQIMGADIILCTVQAAAQGGTITCSTPTATLGGTGSSTGAGYTYQWSGPGIVSGGTTLTPVVNAGGTYTLLVTNTGGGGCTATATASVTENKTPPNVDAGADKVLTCTTTSIALSGSSTTAGATFAWVASGGGHIVSGANTATPTVDAAGTYTLTVTNPANGCTASDAASVSSNTTPPNATATGNTITCGNTTTTITGTPVSGVTYMWTGPGVVSGGNTATATVNAGGVYTLKVTSIANGCTASATASVSVAQCAVLCTYTQGYYGNSGGTSCSGVPDPAPNTYTTTALINHDIAAWGGLIRVGTVGRSVTISTGEAQCVIDKLPGGGGSVELPVGNYSICGLPASLLSKQGRINNTLLAQTITLGLNMGINYPSLANYPLQANKWLVTAETVQCGSPDVKPCQFSCTPGLTAGTYVWTVTYSPYHVAGCRVSTALYNALTTKTVAGLFNLASDALANVDGTAGSERGISLGEIANMVDCINNAFDECRTVVGWFSGETAPSANSFCTLPSSSTPCPITTTGAGGRTNDMTVAGNITVQGLQVSAYPNPYKDAVKFTIQSKVSGNAELIIYNSLGQKMQTLYKGYIQANRSQVVDYKTPSPSQGNLIYVLNLGGKQVTGKLLQVN